jgi:hypothetical protein
VRAQEPRVAALVVRGEANAVSKDEGVLRVGRFVANPPLEARARSTDVPSLV